MLSDSVVSALQLAHALFNGGLFLALVYQGLLGWGNRGRRLAGLPPDPSRVRRHRALGPVLAALLPMGYLAGLFTVYLHRGLWIRYPAHLVAGTVVLALACSAFLASRRIRGAQSPWRSRHFALGLLLLCAFVVQIYLGLNIFL